MEVPVPLTLKVQSPADRLGLKETLKLWLPHPDGHYKSLQKEHLLLFDCWATL